VLLVGLTGGIGSGKSTVAALLASHGCDVIDADEIARGLLAPGGAALAPVLDAFGEGLAGPDGVLDRARLAAIVFADPEQRRRLESITHPLIADAIAERLGRLARRPGAEQAIVVVDHPLLVETGQVDRYDVLVVVLADASLRVERVVTDRGLTHDQVRARMAAQADDAARRAVATHVVVNDGSLEELSEAVAELHATLRERAVEAASGRA
jgi:dephospho-CoA kinase